MSEISINKVENIDEIDQIILLTTCTTKLHRYYRVTLHFLDFHQKYFPEIPHPSFYYPPLLLPLREYPVRSAASVVRTTVRRYLSYVGD